MNLGFQKGFEVVDLRLKSFERLGLVRVNSLLAAQGITQITDVRLILLDQLLLC